MSESKSGVNIPVAADACGCASTGLKKPASWQGMTLASALPGVESAEAAPEPEAAQGEYNPQSIDAPFSVPLIGREAPQHAVELLAPAGGLDAGFAAFHYGADAIYLGLKKFSARAEAENFTFDDVDEITTFAHSLAKPRRVFVTINTLVLQHEIQELVEALGALSDIGVDALIIQDLGVYNIVRKHFPELELHASTQLAVHNRAGAEALRKMGFTRVVLARELTLEEVCDITSTSGVETEVFIHGALCYSYSGLCLFSSQTTGRSGNRGKCAYSCRDEFKISGAPDTLRDGHDVKRDPNAGFAFSMKDLALPDHLPALRAAGVSCVKIEGRKKSPLYVATTTDYYRRLLDGSLAPAERQQHEADMKTVFSRPWTRLFTLSHKDKEVADRDTVGHRGNPIGVVDDVVALGSEMPMLRVKISRPIERHDGLQIDVPGLGKPFGFAVETLRVLDRNGRPGNDLFEAPAGAMVEVALPEEHPELPVGAAVYCSSSQDVKRRYRHSRPKPGQHRARRKVDIAVEINAEKIGVRAIINPRHARDSAADVYVSLAGDYQTAKDPKKMTSAVLGAFEKLGETRLELGSLHLNNPGDFFVPVSQVNELRRRVAGQLQAKLDEAWLTRIKNVGSETIPAEPKNALTNTPEPRWSLKIDRLSFVDAFEAEDWHGIDELLVDIARDHVTILHDKLEQISKHTGPEKIRIALPPLTRKWEEKGLAQKIEKLRQAGWRKWEAGNASAWTFLNADPLDAGCGGPDLATDWSVYVINRAAALQTIAMGAKRFALSPEDGLSNMRSLLREFGDKAVVIAHQDTPMFLAESCAYANLIGGCPGKANCKFESMDMVNSYGEKVQAIDYHCRTIVLNKGAFCLAPRLKDLRAAGAQLLRADFVYRKYDPETVRKAWRLVRAGKNVPGGHAANFDRGML
jgi:U32 family peptidase